MNTELFSKNLASRLTLSGLLIALGVVLSTVYIPLGGAKLFPIQHLINVIGAILLGPIYATINAFLISVIRNMVGTGSLLAFPGSMIGAFIAGHVYKRFKSYRLAALGELFGTGILGAMIAAPFAILFLGKEVGLFFFVIPFVISSFAGALIALALFETTALITLINNHKFES